MKSVDALKAELFGHIDSYGFIFSCSYPAVEIKSDFVKETIEIYKDNELIKAFDFTQCDAIKWPSLERDLWDYLADLTLKLSAERMKQEDAKEIDEDIPF